MASWPVRLWHTVMVGCMVSLQLVSSEGVESTALYSAHCGPETSGSTAKLRFLMDCDGCCPSNLMNRKKCHPNSTVQFHSGWNAMIWCNIDSILLLDTEPWQKIEEFDKVWVCQDMPSQTHQNSNLQTPSLLLQPCFSRLPPVKALMQALVKPEQKSVLGGEHLSLQSRLGFIVAASNLGAITQLPPILYCMITAWCIIWWCCDS